MVIAPSTLAFLDILSGPELVVVLAVALMFFGRDKMPEFARGLGKVIREFKKAAGDVEREFKRVIDEAEHPPVPAPKPALSVAPPEHAPEPFEQHYDCPEDAASPLPHAADHEVTPETPPAPEHAPEAPPGVNRIRPEPPATPGF